MAGTQAAAPSADGPQLSSAREPVTAAAVRIRSPHPGSGGRVDLIVDAGCGAKPYYPWVARRCERYVGLDVGSGADVRARMEHLPLRDDCADIVLCTQVLEHVDDPARVVGEIGRVLKPGGVALLSTHGVYRYHPTPVDYWRWTGSGLRRLAVMSGQFSSVDVRSCGGTVASLMFLAVSYLGLTSARVARLAGPAGVAVSAAAAPIIALLNLAGQAIDSRLSRQAEPERESTLISNYLLILRP